MGGNSELQVECFSELTGMQPSFILDTSAFKAMPTWEEWTEDVTAVLDAVGSERAAILASLDAGPIAIMFAAMHPERVSSLILLNTTARYSFSEDYLIGVSPENVEAFALLEEVFNLEDQLARLE